MPIRKISYSDQDFFDFIDKLADLFHLHNIECNVTVGCEDIDTFYGGVHKVEINGYRDGQKIKKTVVMKWHPDPETRAYFRESYKREYVFYQYIVPKLLDIQRHFEIIEGLKIKFPNCILASAEYDKETIAILGLQEDGFMVRDRFHMKDLDHASIVMKYLAKLHALSFVLAKTNPIEFEKIRDFCRKDVQYSEPSTVSKSMKWYYNTSVNVVSDPVAKERLKALGSDILSILNKCTLPAPSYSTFCHADCWNCNILYKYMGSRPVDVVLIDYQLVRYASPVTDISYFLYMSTEKGFLSKYYNQLIDIYYGTLAAVIRQCNLDVNDIYPRNVFQKHLRDYSVFGLIEALVSMKIITAQSEKALRMIEMKYQLPNEELCEAESKNHSSFFVERVNGVVNDFFERDYSLDAVLNY